MKAGASYVSDSALCATKREPVARIPAQESDAKELRMHDAFPVRRLVEPCLTNLCLLSKVMSGQRSRPARPPTRYDICTANWRY